jgi:succinate dehydrogenase hydrophobic anchor subunit
MIEVVAELLAKVLESYQNYKTNQENKIPELLQSPSFLERWKSVRERLADHIRDVDRDMNWQPQYYTPLNADVEVEYAKGKKKQEKDLLTAIRASKDKLFLLIGEPGAGKSVALRKLCYDLLKVEDATSKDSLPLYVNLKEWVMDTDWHENPPTATDLKEFVKAKVRRGDIVISDFFDITIETRNYFDILYENGRLFFVLDSFDEIPQLLGLPAEHELIRVITRVCRDFLRNEVGQSKGLLASREYRSPRKNEFEAKTFIRVRPFREDKIITTLTKHSQGKITKEAAENFLKDNRRLIPILKNPFITSLLRHYLENNPNQTLETQAELFQNYTMRSIATAQRALGRGEVSFDKIWQLTIQIADLIFAEKGLQAPLTYLENQIKDKDLNVAVRILQQAHIARRSLEEFTFVHRRFYEYFKTQQLLRKPLTDDILEAIPVDSRWRDTLVLYCEVAAPEEATRIAQYCWKAIQEINDVRHPKTKHCLRFLVEAYKGRRKLIKFEPELAEWIFDVIKLNRYLPAVKLAAEALSLLSDDNLKEGMDLGVALRDEWITETLMRSCIHSEVEHLEKVNKALCNTIDPKPNNPFHIPTISPSVKEIGPALKLGDGFKEPLLDLNWQTQKAGFRAVTFTLIVLLIFGYPFLAKAYLDNSEQLQLAVCGIISFPILIGLTWMMSFHRLLSHHYQTSERLEELTKPYSVIWYLKLFFNFLKMILAEFLAAIYSFGSFLAKVKKIRKADISSLLKAIFNRANFNALSQLIGWVVMIGGGLYFVVPPAFRFVYKVATTTVPQVNTSLKPIIGQSTQYPLLWLIGTLIVVVLLYHVIPTLRAIWKDKKQKEAFIENILGGTLILFSIFCVGVILYFVWQYWSIVYSFGGAAIGIVVIGGGLYLLYEYWKKMVQAKTAFETELAPIYRQEVIDRTYIEQLFKKYSSQKCKLETVLTALENNTKNVKGIFRDGFLIAGDPFLSRLSRLEEQWNDAADLEQGQIQN